MDIYIISISWLLWLVLSEHVGASVFYFFFFFFVFLPFLGPFPGCMEVPRLGV